MREFGYWVGSIVIILHSVMQGPLEGNGFKDTHTRAQCRRTWERLCHPLTTFSFLCLLMTPQMLAQMLAPAHGCTDTSSTNHTLLRNIPPHSTSFYFQSTACMCAKQPSGFYSILCLHSLCCMLFCDQQENLALSILSHLFTFTASHLCI